MIVTIDFETFYSQEYSLRRMSEVDYILSPLFQTICCAIKLGNEPSKIFVGHDAIARHFSTIPWERVALLSHNMRFDGAICAWHYRVRPKMYLCTLSMARALTHIAAGGSSLAKVSTYLGLPDKGDAVVHAIGKRLEDFGADLPGYLAYCVNDNELCRSIFTRFRPVFPNSELAVVDATARMFIEPCVRLDHTALVGHLATVRAERELAFAKVAHIDKAVFSSNQKFAALLESLGVEVPKKISPATGLETFALAKNDRGFKELFDDDTQPLEVQAVMAARVGAKSTQEESRTETLLNLAGREWGDRTIGWMPVPLKYYGAHTGRFSGDGGFNFQNLRRGSPLRSAIVAPAGRRIVHRDSSQIEARMVAWLARCSELLVAFAQGRDVYSEFAGMVYGHRVTKADVQDRFVGKTCVGADTLVLTNKGAVRIVDVTLDHKLWDGIQWVSHDGLIAQGQRETLTLSGVSLTPDHHVWCGTWWREARYLARDASGLSLKSALSAANLPSPAMSSANVAACSPSWCSARVASPNTWLTTTTSRPSAAPGAMPALSSRHRKSAGGNTPTPCPTMGTAPACSTDSQLRSRGVTRPPVASMTAMADAGLACTLIGGLIAQLSCATSRLAWAGITRLSTWTARTTRAITSRATSGSRPPPRTPATNAGSTTSKPASATLKLVYDLTNAGPRSRFTILTNDGPLIVSNCILGLGYGMGPERFRHTLFIGNGGISKQVELDEAARIVHLYRRRYAAIPALWAAAQSMLNRMIWLGRPHKIGAHGDRNNPNISGLPDLPGVTWTAEAIWLPNGMAIQYPGLRHDTHNTHAGGREIETVYDGGRGRGVVKLFGGKVVENISQALARIVITDVATRVRAQTGFSPFLSTHDSLDYCCDVDQAEALDVLLEHEFQIKPSWAEDLPLASEGGWGSTLSEAERRVNQ